MTNKLKEFLTALKTLRKDIVAEKVKQVAKKGLREQAEKLGSQWFQEFSDQLTQQYGISHETLEKYSTGCGRLIAISSPNNLKKSYVEVLNSLVKTFRADLIMPTQTGGSASPSLALLHNILRDIPDPEENAYLQEAITCAQRELFRAAIVLGWCATIDRIHRRIEDVGFSKFNVSSAQMASQKKGRFKRFNSPQNVNSLSEIREVFDTNVLWIIEGMGLIDSNQYTRLRSCFDMRCQCAHPGQAPITDYNLMSFFSDLNQIVFKNPMFKI